MEGSFWLQVQVCTYLGWRAGGAATPCRPTRAPGPAGSCPPQQRWAASVPRSAVEGTALARMHTTRCAVTHTCLVKLLSFLFMRRSLYLAWWAVTAGHSARSDCMTHCLNMALPTCQSAREFLLAFADAACPQGVSAVGSTAEKGVAQPT